MEIVDNILAKKEIRITPMRQLLLEHFLKHSKTFGLQELVEVFPKSDRITMYRTLKHLKKKALSMAWIMEQMK